MDKIFLPLTKAIFAKTISSDLVSVQPMGSITAEIEAEVREENRQRKIDSVINDTKFCEMRPEDHPDYNAPKGKLFYFDYQINGNSSDVAENESQNQSCEGRFGRIGSKKKV